MSDNEAKRRGGAGCPVPEQANKGADAAARPLPPAIQGKLGSKLREQYGALLSEPLPSKFGTLLDQLARSEDKS